MRTSKGWEDVFGQGLPDPGRDASRRKIRDQLSMERRNSRERMRRKLYRDSRYGRRKRRDG